MVRKTCEDLLCFQWKICLVDALYRGAVYDSLRIQIVVLQSSLVCLVRSPPAPMHATPTHPTRRRIHAAAPKQPRTPDTTPTLPLHTTHPDTHPRTPPDTPPHTHPTLYTNSRSRLAGEGADLALAVSGGQHERLHVGRQDARLRAGHLCVPIHLSSLTLSPPSPTPSEGDAPCTPSA